MEKESGWLWFNLLFSKNGVAEVPVEQSIQVRMVCGIFADLKIEEVGQKCP
jgi:hypothetical protein